MLHVKHGHVLVDGHLGTIPARACNNASVAHRSGPGRRQSFQAELALK
jgi:hypothetical protein